MTGAFSLLFIESAGADIMLLRFSAIDCTKTFVRKKSEGEHNK
jgi:hypothetical protein